MKLLAILHIPRLVGLKGLAQEGWPVGHRVWLEQLWLAVEVALLAMSGHQQAQLQLEMEVVVAEETVEQLF